MTTIWTFADGTEIEFQGKKEEFFSIDNPRFPMERIDEMTTIYDIDKLQRDRKDLRKGIQSALEFLESLANYEQQFGGIYELIHNLQRLLEETK